ncbi:unnamed protein product [Lepeophtheirus salmonis]|uniref:(salmon louse) hypothetical protein n=1 Tax=Lepeophtheirus salmonis TaxID=72036 RepID=A0A7R8CLN9_LEPSM|nr:unnamed protein product [Lepeophtheirus salmonis]CAF2859890.1 unnamed protein product [Lepeophtheirus salmonis]
MILPPCPGQRQWQQLLHLGQEEKRRHHQVCSVANCPNPRDVSYHSFPKEPELQIMWVQSCGREKQKYDFLRDLKNELLGLPLVKRLKPGSVPTLNLGLHPQSSLAQLGKKKHGGIKVINANPHVLLKHLQSSSPNDSHHSFSNLHHDYTMSPVIFKNGSLDLTNEATSVINQVNQACTLQKLKSLQEKYTLEKKRHRAEIMTLKKELKHIKSKSYVDNLVYKTLLKTQTPAQASKILKPDTNVKGYTKKDITFSLALQSISNKAYKYIDSKNIIALPSNRTLERWIKTTHCPPGLQENGIQRIKDLLENTEEEYERYAVISVNEMILKKKCEYDTLTKNIFGPHSKVQTVIISGLVKDFSQPIYYEFDTNINKNLFLDIIQCLEENGIPVVATTISLRNHKLISELGLNSAQHSFPNPFTTDRVIYAFADTLHMLRLLRNHVIDNGFQIPDGNTGFVPLIKLDFENILTHDAIVPSDEKLHNKLTRPSPHLQGECSKKNYSCHTVIFRVIGKGYCKRYLRIPSSVKAKAVFIINNCVRDILADGNFPSALKVVMHLRILNISQNEDDATLKNVGTYSSNFTPRDDPLNDEYYEKDVGEYTEEHLEEEYGEEEDGEETEVIPIIEAENEYEEVQFDLSPDVIVKTNDVGQVISHEETVVPEIGEVIEKETEESDGAY